MTQENKDLVLRDLCARLPYGVHIRTNNKKILKLWGICQDDINGYWVNSVYELDEVKPYLRPMSSMTEEERDYVVKNSLGYITKIGGGAKDEKLYFHFKVETYDWLNKKMFDFRGLIPKDLALSTEMFNPYKD